MTTDAQLAPTDDEIHAVVQACRERGLREFDVFRAVLAKWGQPAHSGEPVAWLNPWRADQVTTDYDAYGEHGIALYTAPQALAAPLSEDAVQDAAFEVVRKRLCTLPRYSFVLDDDGLVRRAPDRTGNWIEFDEAHALFDPAAVDAALAAQGGKA